MEIHRRWAISTGARTVSNLSSSLSVYWFLLSRNQQARSEERATGPIPDSWAEIWVEPMSMSRDESQPVEDDFRSSRPWNEMKSIRNPRNRRLTCVFTLHSSTLLTFHFLVSFARLDSSFPSSFSSVFAISVRNRSPTITSRNLFLISPQLVSFALIP